MFQGQRLRTILLIAGVIFVILVWVVSVQHGEKFESSKWKSWKETESSLSLRWDMMGDLQRNYGLRGMSKSQVFDLLGPPDNITGTEHSYYLGFARKGINTGRLTIIFGNDQLVSEISVWNG